MNGVAHRVNISRRFSERSLPTVDLSGALVLCDIEGAEADLLTPTLVKRLVASTVVIEVHEDVRPGTGAALTRLFAPSHQVERLDQAASENSPATHENMRAPLLHWLIARPAGTSIRLRHSSGSV
ncbi:MAG: hypothetical protein M0T77_06515 [Actinomycetota bacterium]|nr:hypothetical protein [Actinomycetota bacterium]